MNHRSQQRGIPQLTTGPKSAQYTALETESTKRSPKRDFPARGSPELLAYNAVKLREFSDPERLRRMLERSVLAEGDGFEPSIRFPVYMCPGVRLQPLGHPSAPLVRQARPSPHG